MFLADGFFNKLFWDSIGNNLLNIFLSIDAVIYSIISWLYTIFIAIAEARIFTTETISTFIDRLYLIVGVVALFFGAYIFLTIIINPDNMSKGNASPSKLVRNIVLGIVALVFVPTVFNFAYSLQYSVIEQNVIPRLFFSSHSAEYDESVNSFSEFGVTVFQGSFYLKEGEGITDAERTLYEEAKKSAILHNDIKYFASGGVMDLVQQNKVQYNFFISGIIGIVLLFIFTSYCINIAVRTVKLCFLQIMAPFPCLLLMIPGQEKTFKKWVTECLKTFFEVFVIIALIVFSIFLIQKLQVFFELNKDTLFRNFSVDVVNFSKIFLIIGICIFLKRAPKLMSDITGFELGNSGLSLKNTVKEFKESISPVTSFADKTAGMIGGAIAANQAYKEGLKHGNKGSALKKGLSTFNGMRNGWNGGIRNIGKAYDYELDVQDSYAHNRNKSSGAQVIGGISDSLRDNFGFGSRYDYIKRKAELDRDIKNAPDLESINNLSKASSDRTQQIKDEHQTYINDNTAVSEAHSKWNDAVEKTLSKTSSTEKFVSNATTPDSRTDTKYKNSEYNSFKTSYTDSTTGKTGMYNLYDLNKIRNDDIAAGKSTIGIDAAIAAHGQAYLDYVDLTSNMNWSQLDNMATRANTNENITESERAKIINAVEAAKDAIKAEYIQKDEDDQDSSVVATLNEYRNLLKISGTKVGKKTKVDASGKVSEVEVLSSSDIDAAILEPRELLKLKKAFSKIVDQEKMIVNNALSEATIKHEVFYYDDNGNKVSAKDKSLLEIERIIAAKKTSVEERNKATEKIIESYESEKQNAEQHKHLAQIRGSIKGNGPKGHGK